MLLDRVLPFTLEARCTQFMIFLIAPILLIPAHPPALTGQVQHSVGSVKFDSVTAPEPGFATAFAHRIGLNVLGEFIHGLQRIRCIPVIIDDLIMRLVVKNEPSNDSFFSELKKHLDK